METKDLIKELRILEKSSKLGEQACICGEAANRLEELLQEIEISRRLEKSENHKENDDRKQLLSKNKKKMEVKKNVLKPLQSFLKSGRKIYITGFEYDEMSYVLHIDDKYLNDFVGDYTVFDLMILDANTYIVKEEGIEKEDLGREKFLERAWDWKEEYGGTIIEQMKKLGSSCDWDRERFTMDEGCSEAVKEVFIKLYEKGYIYRGSRIINWCPVCQTSISDAEVEYEDQAGHFWHIKYPVVGSEGEYVEIATTRPETLLGDSAVAVHPDDERYTHLVGKMLELPLCNRQIPVVADEYVDREFGTGAVKITPAHDPNDFEVGNRHNLERIVCINPDGTMNENALEFKGLDRFTAREKLIEKLKEELN